MSIEVRVPTILRRHTGGQSKVTGDGGTLRELLADLDERNPGLRDALLDEDGSLRRFLNVYLNDEDVRFLVGAETPLSDDDVVSVLPAVAGGARARR